MGLHKLVDVPILHPPRHHSELVLGHCHPQQRQHVWMPEGPPSDDLFAELLQMLCLVSQRVQGKQSPPVTHVSHIL